MNDQEVDEMIEELNHAFNMKEQELIDVMVRRFLMWQLPKDFMPDCGIYFSAPADGSPEHFWPVGTNLFNADQAKEMIRFMLDGVDQ